MARWSHCAAMGVVAVAMAAMVARRAASDDCLHVCAETDKDDRGCCPAAKSKVPPKTEPKVPSKTPPKAAATPKATGATTTTPTTKPSPRSVGRCPSGMVHVPAGTFTMGSADGLGEAEEHPAHPVTLEGYCLDKTEVTVAAYGACVATKACTATTEPAMGGIASLCNGTQTGRRNHPVNCVDWNQATAYCTWASKRLPTEAEWEHAARGNDGRVYAWGNDAPSKRHVNACASECLAMAKRLGFGNEKLTPIYPDDDAWEATAPVGSFPGGMSPFGALDMTGNVWEWTADRYGPYAAGAATNPTGASTGSTRVFRGGGWFDFDTDSVRGALRSMSAPAERRPDLGFRCASRD